MEIMLKSTECKTCKKKFHACSSCGLLNSWEYVYCSEECWKKSKVHRQTLDGILGLDIQETKSLPSSSDF